MTTPKQPETQIFSNPFLQAAEVTQTLFSDILNSQSQLVINSMNQITEQAGQIMTNQDPQSLFEQQQTNLNHHHQQLSEFSENLSSSFAKAQANYQNIFTSAALASDVAPTAQSNKQAPPKIASVPAAKKQAKVSTKQAPQKKTPVKTIAASKVSQQPVVNNTATAQPRQSEKVLATKPVNKVVAKSVIKAETKSISKPETKPVKASGASVIKKTDSAPTKTAEVLIKKTS